MVRFPEPGQTKTRLIPAVGPERAASLHQELARRTFHQLVLFRQQHECDVDIQFAGGDADRMRKLFGSGFEYIEQGPGSLGDRMDAAIHAAFIDGAQRVVIIGTDCPKLTAQHIEAAFATLRQHDAVIGPALDGGYYLLGQRKYCPALFRKIDWSTDKVLQQTLVRAKACGIRVHRLESLADVDYAEDLLPCRRQQDQFPSVLPITQPGLLSVIVPTLNEADNIGLVLSSLQDVGGIEVIVADGGSTDTTINLALEAGAAVVHCNKGRGRQMNAAAALARGEVLLFLHADTRLPPGFQHVVWHALDRQGKSPVVAGAFRLRIDDSGLILRIIEWSANLRSRWLSLPYGDQAIFVRAEVFYQMNGFQHWPLMEDYDLCRRLRRLGRIVTASATVLTSARRWKTLGAVRTTFMNQLCVIGFHLGIPLEKLANYYRSAYQRAANKT